MSTAVYAIGRPRAALSRGGDCRARDITQAREIHGPHRFATTGQCQISNGLLRLTVGASGVAPTLTIECWRGRVVINDFLSDILSDILPGEYSTPAWFAMGTITIDSTLLTALLTAVRLVRLTPEAVTIRLVAPVMGDAFVTLRRGERQVRIQHGSTRAPVVSTSRRVQWTGSPSLTGSATTGRVEEPADAVTGLYRFVASIDTVTTARFGAGVGSDVYRDRPTDQHLQLGDVTRQGLVVA